MKDSLELKNPPIVEAIIAVTAEGLDKNCYSEIIEKYLKPNYPVSENVKGTNLEIAERQIVTRQVENQHLFSEDKKETVILDNNRLLLSDKHLYKNFDNLFEKYKRIYEAVYENCSEMKVKNVGLRCINSFMLDLKKSEYEKFCIRPTVVFHAGGVANFFSIVTLVSPTYAATANVTVQMSLDEEEKLNVLFDIDCNASCEGRLTIDDVKGILLRLRNLRNEIFASNFDEKFMMEKFK